MAAELHPIRDDVMSEGACELQGPWLPAAGAYGVDAADELSLMRSPWTGYVHVELSGAETVFHPGTLDVIHSWLGNRKSAGAILGYNNVVTVVLPVADGGQASWSMVRQIAEATARAVGQSDVSRVRSHVQFSESIAATYVDYAPAPALRLVGVSKPD